jgi:hypothetical protein
MSETAKMNDIASHAADRPQGVDRVRLQSWFVVSCGLVFLLVGLAKIASFVDGADVLKVIDPIFNVQIGSLLLSVGLMECAVASFCLKNRHESGSLGLVAWVALLLFVYRVGVAVVGWERPCSCLGSLTRVLGISEGTGNRIAVGLLGYMLSGSCLFIYAKWYTSSLKPNRNEE